MRHRYVFLSALAIVAAGLVFSLYGNYRGTIADFIMKNGWVMMLYQLPLANGIFFPIMATVVASRLADAEHKASAFKHLFTLEKREKIYDAKLIIGIVLMILCVLIYWAVVLVFGTFIGFEGAPPHGYVPKVSGMRHGADSRDIHLSAWTFHVVQKPGGIVFYRRDRHIRGTILHVPAAAAVFKTGAAVGLLRGNAVCRAVRLDKGDALCRRVF